MSDVNGFGYEAVNVMCNLLSNTKTTYVACTLSGAVSVLTINDIVGVSVAIATILFTWLTYRSNNKRNAAQAKTAQAQRELAEALKQANSQPQSASNDEAA